MRVREANLSDVAPMAQVMVDSFLAAHLGQIPEKVWKWRQQNWTYEFCGNGWERTLRGIADSANPHECVYVAEAASGAIIGLAMGRRATANVGDAAGEICAIYLHPDHQRQGIGRCLVAAIASRMTQWGRVTLHIGTLKANAPARRFYESLGGRVVGERDVEDAGCLLPEVVYGWSDFGSLVATAGSERRAGETDSADQVAPRTRESAVYPAEDFQDLPFDVSKHAEALKSFETLKLASASVKPALRARELVSARFPGCSFRIAVTGNPDAQAVVETGQGSAAFEVIYQADSPLAAAQVRDEVERYFLRHYPGRILKQAEDAERKKEAGNYVYVALYTQDD